MKQENSGIRKERNRSSWQLLQDHYQSIQNLHLRNLFSGDPGRGERMAIEDEGIYFDYSKHRITEDTIRLLLQLAQEFGLAESIEALFRGDRINITENRPALHIALRLPKEEHLFVDGKDVVPEVHHVLDRMADFSNRIRRGQWKGYTGKPLRNIINIGIGGSYLGPVMAYEALRYYSQRDLTVRFISNIDGTDFYEKTHDLDPEETLFIVASKTFTTLETMTNAWTARDWILGKLKDEGSVGRHFAAISTNLTKARKFGILPENIFGFWDWVGGRYSLCSAIGLSTMIAIGSEKFREMLHGFHQMDYHFRKRPFDQNIPVIMGLLGIWYNNFFGSQTVAVLPYEDYLKRFPAYLQQLTMESNGKSVTIDGKEVAYQTGPIYWGEPGTNGQHSFYQLIHQGTKLVPCDFIVFSKPLNPVGSHHDLLVSNVFAQAKALAFGKTKSEVEEENISAHIIPHCVFKGNSPSTVIILDQLTPVSLGKLIALYEHLVFTQSVVWRINPFDQWGVELGKSLSLQIASEIKSQNTPILQHDSSTNRLILRYREQKK